MPRMPASSHTTWPAQSACHHCQHLPPCPPPLPPGPHRTPLAHSLDRECLSKSRPSACKPGNYLRSEVRRGSDSQTPPLEVQGFTSAHSILRSCISYSHPAVAFQCQRQWRPCTPFTYSVRCRAYCLR